MSNIFARLFRYVSLVVSGLAVLAFAAVLLGWAPPPWKPASAAPGPSSVSRRELGVELVPEVPHTLRVPEEVRKSLGIRKGGRDLLAVARLPTREQTLVLPGSTILDPAHLMRIRARFAPARVVEIAPVPDERESLTTGRTQFRELRSGDRVRKGDLLGVFYSVDVGNKKNDLIDALVQLRLDQKILDLAEECYRKGAVPEVFLLNAQKAVDADHYSIKRAVNTLRTWDIPETDIEAVYKEVEQVSKRQGNQRDPAKEKDWPRVELRAPDDGTIVERNVTQHEMVVDNTVNLFQIAKVDRLVVLANAPEDDLPTLEGLPTTLRQWTVRTVGAAPVKGLSGPIDEVGYLIDPNQHTAVIKGHIDNPGGRIRAGQFVSATVRVPPPEYVVELPMDALVDDGKQSIVFVQTDKEKHHYTMRRVQVTHRFDRTVFVRSTPILPEEQRAPEEEELGLLPREPLRVGEVVLKTGAVELKAALLDKEAQPKKDKKQDQTN